MGKIVLEVRGQWLVGVRGEGDDGLGTCMCVCVLVGVGVGGYTGCT